MQYYSIETLHCLSGLSGSQRTEIQSRPHWIVPFPMRAESRHAAARARANMLARGGSNHMIMLRVTESNDDRVARRAQTYDVYGALQTDCRTVTTSLIMEDVSYERTEVN